MFMAWLGVRLLVGDAAAFCGTYIGQAGADLFNRSSQVAIVRQDDRTTLTLTSDYEGDLDEFAILIPVPEVLAEGDVRVVSSKLIERLDGYSAPRLVAYDCSNVGWTGGMATMDAASASGGSAPPTEPPTTDGVTIEAEYLAGSYEIVILSATESSGLLSWLNRNGYAISADTEDTLAGYIEAEVLFFAAKLHLESVGEGGNYLAPLQFSYQSEAWSLPIQLGKLNSPGFQDLTIYVVNDYVGGAAAISNLTELELESECMWEDDGDFGSFYADTFESAVRQAGGAGWIQEYSWDPSWCDPCSDDPLTTKEVRALGFKGTPFDAHFTRLRVGMTREAGPDELMLYSSGISTNDQMKYVSYLPELEGNFPICGVGWVDGVDECPPAKNKFLGIGGTCSVASAPALLSTLLASVGLVWVRRRRS